MNRRRLTLIEVLEPQCFKTTPERSRVTRTIVQPEIDAFEQMEERAGATEKSALAKRHAPSRASAIASPITAPLPSQLAPQLVGA